MNKYRHVQIDTYGAALVLAPVTLFWSTKRAVIEDLMERTYSLEGLMLKLKLNNLAT